MAVAPPVAAPARRPGIALPTVSEGTMALLVSAALILFVVRWVPRPYPDLARFSEDALKNVPNVMAPLVMIALFVERAVEVIMSAWRAQESQHLEADLLRAQQEIAGGTPRPDYPALQSRVIAYKATSQRLAFLVGFVISLVVAMAGVRAMEMLVVPASVKAFGSSAQQQLFVWADVFLTATLLAGGADGLHKIVSTFTAFLDSTKQNTTGVAPTAPAPAPAGGGGGGGGGGAADPVPAAPPAQPVNAAPPVAAPPAPVAPAVNPAAPPAQPAPIGAADGGQPAAPPVQPQPQPNVGEADDGNGQEAVG